MECNDAELLAKQMSDTYIAQIANIEKSLDDFSQTAIQASKSILLDSYTQLVIIEIQKATKFYKANWLTKWYHKRAYSKAKYQRIKLQRFIKQNYYNNDRSDNR